MNVVYDNSRGQQCQISLDSYVENALYPAPYTVEGELEKIRAYTANVARALGRLMDVLAERKILDAEDVENIVAKWDKIVLKKDE